MFSFKNLVLLLALIFGLLTAYAEAGACSGGVNVCCGSSSVGCSGNICKACCGNTCGCFYAKGSHCNSQQTPCVNPSNPDFATTNGECKAPKKSSGSSSNSGSLSDFLHSLGIGL